MGLLLPALPGHCGLTLAKWGPTEGAQTTKASSIPAEAPVRDPGPSLGLAGDGGAGVNWWVIGSHHLVHQQPEHIGYWSPVPFTEQQDR